MPTIKPHLEAMRGELELAAEELSPDVGLRFRAMFGGLGAYGRDRMVAALSDAGLALTPSSEDRAALLAEEGAQAWQSEEGRPVISKEYVVVPPRIREDATSLAAWVRRSIDHAAGAPVEGRWAIGNGRGSR
jgi:TfoX/Sxy family transcriptional regulator of competence genes